MQSSRGNLKEKFLAMSDQMSALRGWIKGERGKVSMAAIAEGGR